MAGANLYVSVDCGELGSGQYNQTLIVSEADEGTAAGSGLDKSFSCVFLSGRTVSILNLILLLLPPFIVVVIQRLSFKIIPNSQ